MALVTSVTNNNILVINSEVIDIYCFNISRALFPCGDNMVCIIDDREDVWRHATNLIHVRPYSFFQSTGDINAPPSGINLNLFYHNIHDTTLCIEKLLIIL